MYPYIIMADDTKITHSQIIETNGIKTVEVHFERASDSGVDRAHCVLPSYLWTLCEGFSDGEIRFFDEFLRHNQHLLFRYAAQGGINEAPVCTNEYTVGAQTTPTILEELADMEVHPEKYKRYPSFRALMDETLSEDK